MEITVDVLDARIAGLNQQLQQLLDQANQVRGAIADCIQLREYLNQEAVDDGGR